MLESLVYKSGYVCPTFCMEEWQGLLRVLRIEERGGEGDDMKVIFSDPQNIEFALKAMRAPYESFGKASDEGDEKLLISLIKAGPEHRKVLRMVQINAEILAPRYFYQQLDTYKIGSTCSSSSTMHLLGSKREFSLDDFQVEPTTEESVLAICRILNAYLARMRSGELGEREARAILKSLLPESYLQLRFYQFSMETLLRIYQQRKDHALAEWRYFCSEAGQIGLVRKALDALGLLPVE